jgi:hypothetical protein
MLKFYEQYGRCIELEEFTQELDLFIDNSKYPLPREVYAEQFGNILEDGLGKNFDYVCDQVLDWTTYQQMKLAILTSINLLQKKRDYEGIVKVITEAKVTRAQAQAKLDLAPISSIEEEPINWLWKDVIPFGMLTIVSGEAGVGKSFIGIELASRLSTGRPMPGCASGVTGNTIYMIKELPRKQILKPRFVAAEADMERVEQLTGFYIKEKQFIVFDTNKNMELLERHVVGHPEVRLLVIDPIISFLSEATDLNAPGGRGDHALEQGPDAKTDHEDGRQSPVTGLVHFRLDRRQGFGG